MTEAFCQIPKEMMRATHWISKTTGQQFKLTGTQKIIWVHMVDRYKFFKSLGNEWFDDQEDIAKDAGCDVSTVKGFIKQLVEHGYMAVERKKLRGFVYSNSYKIVAPLDLYNRGGSGARPEQSFNAAATSTTSIASAPVIAPQAVVEPLVDIPLDAYIDDSVRTPVIVHQSLRGFADTLDEEIDYDVPVLPKEVAHNSSEPDLWG